MDSKIKLLHVITGLINKGKQKQKPKWTEKLRIDWSCHFFTPVWGVQSCKKPFLFLIAQALLWMQKEKKSAIQQLIQGVSKSAPW